MGQDLSENGPERGIFQWESTGGLLESDAIVRGRDAAVEMEDNREMEVQKGKQSSLCQSVQNTSLLPLI